jgi:hypothetical protein
METKIFTKRYLPFLSGTICGMMLLGIFLMITGSKPAEPLPPQTVSRDVARTDLNRFVNSPQRLLLYLSPTDIQPLKGIPVDLDGMRAMEAIYANNNNVTGFKVYFGIDNNNRRVSIIVGLTDNTHADFANIMESTRSYDPCPTICDAF